MSRPSTNTYIWSKKHKYYLQKFNKLWCDIPIKNCSIICNAITYMWDFRGQCKFDEQKSIAGEAAWSICLYIWYKVAFIYEKVRMHYPFQKYICTDNYRKWRKEFYLLNNLIFRMIHKVYNQLIPWNGFPLIMANANWDVLHLQGYNN